MKNLIPCILLALFVSGCASLYETTDKSAEYTGKGAKRWCEQVVPFISPDARQRWLAKANEAASPHVIRPIDCLGIQD